MVLAPGPSLLSSVRLQGAVSRQHNVSQMLGRVSLARASAGAFLIERAIIPGSRGRTRRNPALQFFLRLSTSLIIWLKIPRNSLGIARLFVWSS
jgi:hypothetical protein